MAIGPLSESIFRSPGATAPIIIYLPSGPAVSGIEKEENRVVSALGASSGATVARINYRASLGHQFPTPIHDVLLGYDWILDNLLQDETSPKSSRPVISRLGVCGELLGGSLATMLALTECRLGGSRMGAAAVNNPIVDWVFADDIATVDSSQLPEPRAPEETSFPADQNIMASYAQQEEQEAPTKSKKRKKRTPKLTAWQRNAECSIVPTSALSGLRDVLFRRPEDFFDRFASPLHFFRSPHGQLIYPDSDDVIASSSPPIQPFDPLDFEVRMYLSHFEAIGSPPESPPRSQIAPMLARCRSYARIYPPAGVSMSLPQFHISTGQESPLLDQAIELSKVVKRSIARHHLKSRTGRARAHDQEEMSHFEEYAEQRVQLDTAKGNGLWTLLDDGTGEKIQVEAIGVWLRKALDNPS
ncbi:hypothetical protein P154DRAFT_294626 [Amniculicola lignicola CBS 123094]|uniref:Alpha/beta hydrolase fold-3 domain-containing protein n=1 Tax=Amniculicola lignicola CBS 123094 TaxID=1392246 RepID=A0A6A5W7J3_9PLEO|nr:hypothetical protein P154DRAFT_294626 [Amniculicola lignicola CBS 123094]